MGVGWRMREKDWKEPWKYECIMRSSACFCAFFSKKRNCTNA
jgi:hypothetical protein